MEERSWRGNWWVADDPAEVVPGTLLVFPDGSARLELVGGFDTDVRTPLPDGTGFAVSAESKALTIIHGVSGGSRLTLIDSTPVRTRGGVGGGAVMQDISPQRVLIGIHLSRLDESIFVRAHVEMERLLAWSCRSSLSLSLEVSEDGQTPPKEIVDKRPVEPVSAVYGQKTMTLRVTSTRFFPDRRPVANRASLTSTERAVLTFDAPEPVSFVAFDEIDKDVQDLLTLSAYAPCGSLFQSLIFRSSEDHPGSRVEHEVEVVGQQIYRTEIGERSQPHYQFIIALSDLDFGELVPRWLALKSEARLGFNMLFGLRYISSGYVGSRLLTVAAAAESIHRGLCATSTPLPRETFKALRDRILDALAGEPEETKDYVKRSLRNDATYNERMLELSEIPDPATVDRLLGDRAEWAKRLKNARHDLAHANERSSVQTDSSMAFWLLEVTYALLSLVAMAKLGLDSAVQQRALDNPKISTAASQFKRLLDEAND